MLCARRVTLRRPGYEPRIQRAENGKEPKERSELGQASGMRLYAPSVDVLLAWLAERLGSKAVNRSAKVIALVCGLATIAFVAVLLVLLAR